jgi:NAD(P)-dependent dehydrogenase (short-subunit alcohol dehydrogenase family)
MIIDLSEKVALVTGAAGGIGASVAKTLALAGATVIVTDLEIQSAAGFEVVADIQKLGGSAEFEVLDISDERGWISVMEKIQNLYAGLDVLVNNAGVVLVKPIEETTLDELHRICRVNIDGVFLGVRYATPLLKLRGLSNPAGASIINFSSAMGIKGYPFGSLYSLTKGAIRAFSKSIALEFAQLEYNIRVNSVHPGLVDTPMVEQEAVQLSALGAMGTSTPDEMRQAFQNLNPLGRLGTPQELANAVLFLASDLSSFITGSEMTVDGGETAQ